MQVNRNAMWPREKGGHQQLSNLKDKYIEMLHGQGNKADTSRDTKGGHISKKN